MLFAQQKRTENIAEYILYMYQIEDIIRSFNFNVDDIMKKFVAPQRINPSFENQYRMWYDELARQMKYEKIETSGHLSMIQETMIELSYLHNTLLNLFNDEKYKMLYDTALPHIEAFIEKSNLKNKNHIEICFHAMYMKLLLKLQKKEISTETEDAFDAIRILIAYLSKAYQKMQAGELDDYNDQS